MSDGYTKLFSDIVDSSIWDEDAETCKVWVTLLALCNADGLVRGSVGWLAAKSKVTNSACLEALKKFESPDPQSRTPDNDGRRIETLQEGWLVLNYLAFRDRLSSNPIAVKTRERVRKHRERYHALRNVTSVTTIQPASASVVASVPKTLKTKPSLEEVKLAVAKSGLPESDAVWFWNKCEGNGWTVNGKPIKSWPHTIAAWKAAGYLPSQKPVTNGQFNGKPLTKSLLEKELDRI
jgi:hypothetical protein